MDVEESPWADSSQAGKQPASQDAEPTSQDTASAATPSTSQPAAASTASSRPSRGPRRLVAQPTRLEAVDDPLGPLGGAATPSAGDGALSKDDEPPAPPLKEQMVIRTTMPQQQQQQQRRPVDPHHIDDDEEEGEGDGRRGPRAPPPVEAARPTGMRGSTQPSVSVEQAAKPTFHITVGDPVKIGDLTSSHIVYSVRTKVITPYLSLLYVHTGKDREHQGRDKQLTTMVDYLQGVQATRVRGQASVSRFPLALQHTPRKQPWLRCASPSR